MALEGPLGPFACFHGEGVWEKLASHPTTRPYCADSGFRATIASLRSPTHAPDIRELSGDPRVMAAMGVLQGWGLSVSPEDLSRAEWLGQMPKRDAVQMPNIERAATHMTVDDAKAAGNQSFKEGEYADALACWMRALQLHGTALSSFVLC